MPNFIIQTRRGDAEWKTWSKRPFSTEEEAKACLDRIHDLMDQDGHDRSNRPEARVYLMTDDESKEYLIRNHLNVFILYIKSLPLAKLEDILANEVVKSFLDR